MAFPPSDNGNMKNICLVIPPGSFKEELHASFSKEGGCRFPCPVAKVFVLSQLKWKLIFEQLL